MKESNSSSGPVNPTVYFGDGQKGHHATPEDAEAVGLKRSAASLIYRSDEQDSLKLIHCKSDRQYVVVGRVMPVVPRHGYVPFELGGEPQEGDDWEVSLCRGRIYGEGVKIPSFSESNIRCVKPADVQPFLESIQPMGNNIPILKEHFEGVTVRVWFHGEEWKFSTYRKINWENSKTPASKFTYQEMFYQAVPQFDIDQLDKSKIYVFHIQHQENQIMNPFPVRIPLVHHFATIERLTNTWDMPITIMDTQSENKIPGMVYTDALSPDLATAMLALGKSLVLINGYEISHVCTESYLFLMDIRGYDNSPHVPIELMFMRLKLIQRPYLAQCVPAHLNFNLDRIFQWIDTNVLELAGYLASNAMSIHRTGNATTKKPLLKKFIGSINPLQCTPNYNVLKALYVKHLQIMVNADGAKIYQAIKQYKVEKKFLEKKAQDSKK